MLTPKVSHIISVLGTLSSLLKMTFQNDYYFLGSGVSPLFI